MVDGTGADPVRADLCIQDGLISLIGSATGASTFDLTGCTLTAATSTSLARARSVTTNTPRSVTDFLTQNPRSAWCLRNAGQPVVTVVEMPAMAGRAMPSRRRRRIS